MLLSLSLIYVDSCWPRGTQIPKCFAAEEAAGGASEGGGARAEGGEGKEPDAASAMPTSTLTDSAEGAYFNTSPRIVYNSTIL